MALAAFLLHELRYVLAPAGAEEGSEHAYIPFAATVVALLVAIAAGQLALRVARARDDGAGESEPGTFGLVWLGASTGLLVVYAGQELLEAVLAGAPPHDPLAGGGLWALPLALVLGGLAAAALRWACRVVVAAARAASKGRRRPGAVQRPLWRPVRPVASLLGRHLAGRAPPLPS